MGEAKRRGTFEQRKAAAEERERKALLDRIGRQKPDMQPSVLVVGDGGKRVNVGTIGHIDNRRFILPMLMAMAHWR